LSPNSYIYYCKERERERERGLKKGHREKIEEQTERECIAFSNRT
jgi:hypothetical protein